MYNEFQKIEFTSIITVYFSEYINFMIKFIYLG